MSLGSTDASDGTRDAGRADAREASLAGDLRQRLRPVCADWDEAHFEAVIERMARMRARWIDTGTDV